MSYYAGIDLHKRYLTLCILERDGNVVVEHRRLSTDGLFALSAELNLASPATDLFGKQGRIWIDALTLPDEVRFQVDGLLQLLDSLDSRIRTVAKRIEQRVEVTPEAQRLLTVPGIGAKTAMLILAEIGDLSRFPTSHHLTSFAGLVPTTRSSGGKTTHGSLPHAGSPWLRWALVQTTQTLKMKPGPVRAHFARLMRGKGNSKATVAAARKLCCYRFWMLKEGKTYPERLQERQHNQLLEVRPT